jgi:hypothetical protein
MSRTIDGTFTNTSKNAPIQQTRPYDFGTDAIERQRVSLGQSLIDADFEYGIQPTKWQTHQEIRKTPSFYEIPGTDFVITDVVSDGKLVSNIYVGTTSALPPVGSVVTVNGVSNYERTADRAEGFFLVTANYTSPGSFLSLPSNTFTYYSKGQIAQGQLVTPSTTIRRGNVFNGGNCKISVTQISQNSNLVTVYTSNTHGMIPGTPLCSNNWSGVGVVGVNGNFFVESVPQSNSFVFSSTVAAAGTTTPASGSIFVQPYSTVTHRPFDGGVLLTPLVSTHGAMVCRQSKKVFRYQSGKGLLWSSGTLFCPNNDVARVFSNATAVGSNITIQTDVYHGAQVGSIIQLRGIATSGYNGTYSVNSVNDSKSVNVIATTTLGSTLPSFLNQPRFILSAWQGASARAGCFDDQNGLFWEWDGQNLWAVKRSCTFQLAGTVITVPNGQTLVGNTYTDSLISTVTYGTQAITFPSTVNPGDVSTQVTVSSTAGLYKAMHVISGFYPGYIDTAYIISVDSLTAFTIGFAPMAVSIPFGNKTGNVTFVYPTTRFQDQLKVGDKFIIRGMSHTVTAILSQGVLNFNPPYRGLVAPTVPIKAVRVIDQRTNQANFNRDTLDGLGASGYKVDITKMQMIGLQYTWYGAGFVDFMMRGSDGNWVYAHRIRNNNVNDEAYMRTGNLPVRYELINEMNAAVSTLNGQISTTTSNILLNDDTTYWPPFGTVLIDSELLTYSSKGSFALNGVARAQPFNYVINDVARTFTASVATSHATGATVLLTSITTTPSLTHWGSAFLMDGQFDTDRGYYFNYANIYSSNITTTQNAVPLFMLRLAPAVSNGIIGNMGERDLLNRAQLLLQKMEVTANQTINVTGILNPQGFSGINWTPVNSIANQGQPSFCQVSNSFTYSGAYTGGERILSTISAAGSTNVIDLSALKELTGGVIGGPNFFPDGPDTIVIYVQNAGTSNLSSTIVNLFWAEAQA